MKNRRLLIAVAAVVVAGAAAAALGAGGRFPILVAVGNEMVEVGKYGPGEVRCVGGQPRQRCTPC